MVPNNDTRQPPCPEGNLYTIRAGDTFYSIARRFRVSLDDLLEANPGVDPDNLQVGQQICIPLAVPPVRCPEGSLIYTIRAGDTFYSIARRFNTTVEALREANPGVDPDALLIGQQICVPVRIPAPGVCPQGSQPYVIRPGDTYYSLARRFNTTVEAIREANPNVNPDNLQVGMVICIPVVPAPTPCPPGTNPYTVQAGDTYFSLARRFNTTVRAIARANPLVNPRRLRVGQVICIPGAPPPGRCPEGTRPYVIRRGDTYYRLARRFNTTVEAIRQANPGVDPDALQVGQVICIPE